MTPIPIFREHIADVMFKIFLFVHFWAGGFAFHRDKASLIVAEQLANSQCLWGYFSIQQKATDNLVSLLRDLATSQSSSVI